MNDDVDRVLIRLADQPATSLLGGLEKSVSERIAQDNARMVTAPAWRITAVGAALVVGVGVGGTGAAFDGNARQPAILAAGVDLAPSSLLATS